MGIRVTFVVAMAFAGILGESQTAIAQDSESNTGVTPERRSWYAPLLEFYSAPVEGAREASGYLEEDLGIGGTPNSSRGRDADGPAPGPMTPGPEVPSEPPQGEENSSWTPDPRGSSPGPEPLVPGTSAGTKEQAQPGFLSQLSQGLSDTWSRANDMFRDMVDFGGQDLDRGLNALTPIGWKAAPAPFRGILGPGPSTSMSGQQAPSVAAEASLEEPLTASLRDFDSVAGRQQRVDENQRALNEELESAATTRIVDPVTVKNGDYLERIARGVNQRLKDQGRSELPLYTTRNDGLVRMLADHNNIRNPDLIFPGQQIRIPTSIARGGRQ